MRAGLASLFVAVVACAAGCGAHEPEPVSGSKPVTRAERLAIFGDWSGDGRIDGAYPCAVVRDAIRHLPSSPPVYSTVYEDLQRYERRVC